MKKLIAAILTAVLVFGLCACGSDAGGNAAETTEGKSDTFLAGYGRADGMTNHLWSHNTINEAVIQCAHRRVY